MPFARIVLAAPLLALAACGAATADRVSTATTAAFVAPEATQPPLLVVPRDMSPPITITATVTAERITPPPPEPEPTGIQGHPFPPADASNCEQAVFDRIAFGLPAHFDYLVNRESGKGQCLNTAISPTGCCVGWLQLHHIIFDDHRMIDRLAACGHATWFNVRGADPLSKQRQMCAARALYDVSGYAPWKL